MSQHSTGPFRNILELKSVFSYFPSAVIFYVIKHQIPIFIFFYYGGPDLKILSAITLSLLVASGGVFPVCAQKYLTGELSGTYPAGEYVVSGNIHVLPKTQLTFEPGCTLRFENYTGIVVRGELTCRGTSEKPVVFTSSRDVPSSRTMPEAFDWNGIKVTSESDGITLEHCIVAYSTFGLNIESNGTPVTIKEIKFNNNGSASLTRERKMMPVTDNMAISFVWPEMQAAAMVTDSVKKDSVPADRTVNKTRKNAKKTDMKKERAKPRLEWKAPVRITLGSAAAVGGIMWVTGYAISKKSMNDRNSGVPFTPEWNRADKNFKNWVTVQNIGAGLFAIGAVGFSVTFLF